MKVKNAMHKGIKCVEADTAVREIAKRMRKDDIGAIPVSRNGAIIGIVTDRDVTCRAVANGSDLDRLTARDVMTPHVSSCSPDDDLADAIAAMKKKRIRRLPVVDKAKGVVGMLSLGDISRKATRNISGDILRAVSGHHA
jgi:CBS domain-containing protein